MTDKTAEILTCGFIVLKVYRYTSDHLKVYMSR